MLYDNLDRCFWNDGGNIYKKLRRVQLRRNERSDVYTQRSHNSRNVSFLEGICGKGPMQSLIIY